MQTTISVKDRRPNLCCQPNCYRNLQQHRSCIGNQSARGRRSSCQHRWATRGQRMLPQIVWTGASYGWILPVSFAFAQGHRTQVRRRNHWRKSHRTDRHWIHGSRSFLLVVDLASRRVSERGSTTASVSSPKTCSGRCVTHG